MQTFRVLGVLLDEWCEEEWRGGEECEIVDLQTAGPERTLVETGSVPFQLTLAGQLPTRPSRPSIPQPQSLFDFSAFSAGHHHLPTIPH